MQNGEKGFEPGMVPVLPGGQRQEHLLRRNHGRKLSAADVRFRPGEAAADGDFLQDEKLRKMRTLYRHQCEVCG